VQPSESTTNFDHCDDAYLLSIGVQTTLNHISICFLPQYQRPRKCFFRAQAEKGIAQHIDGSSVVWTLVNNGKLANQIARLAAIVVTETIQKAMIAGVICHP